MTLDELVEIADRTPRCTRGHHPVGAKGEGDLSFSAGDPGCGSAPFHLSAASRKHVVIDAEFEEA